MDAIQQQVLKTISEIDRLQDLHKMFIADLEVAAKTASQIGTLTVTPDLFSCKCLGHDVTVTYRPIVLDGKISALEYDFATSWKEEDLSILRLYLQPGGIITRDAKGSEKLCDFNNTYIKNIILGAVFESLIKSPVYAPVVG